MQSERPRALPIPQNITQYPPAHPSRVLFLRPARYDDQISQTELNARCNAIIVRIATLFPASAFLGRPPKETPRSFLDKVAAAVTPAAFEEDHADARREAERLAGSSGRLASILEHYRANESAFDEAKNAPTAPNEWEQ
jgi:hypothetical protein